MFIHKELSTFFTLKNNLEILQEISNQDVMMKLMVYLGDKWQMIMPNKSYPDTAIITRHSVFCEFTKSSSILTVWLSP